MLEVINSQNREEQSTGLPLPRLEPARWIAFLRLTVARTFRGTRLISNEHQGPLYVQKTFHPEGDDIAHIYILHPPGGLVSGDTLSINLTAEANTHSLYTTPGAGRIYRARVDKSTQSQQVHINIGECSSIEWLPLETIVFPGAEAKFSNRVDIQLGGHFLGWEITCLGLPASSQSFDSGTFHQQLEIYYNGKPRIIENLRLDAADDKLLNGAMGFRGYTVTALMTAGPFDDGIEENELLSKLRAIVVPSSVLIAVTQTRGFILVRYLGHCSSNARAVLIEAWQLLRLALLGRSAQSPRIWAC